jgi:hypothetical protein
MIPKDDKDQLARQFEFLRARQNNAFDLGRDKIVIHPFDNYVTNFSLAWELRPHESVRKVTRALKFR